MRTILAIFVQNEVLKKCIFGCLNILYYMCENDCGFCIDLSDKKFENSIEKDGKYIRFEEGVKVQECNRYCKIFVLYTKGFVIKSYKRLENTQMA